MLGHDKRAAALRLYLAVGCGAAIGSLTRFLCDLVERQRALALPHIHMRIDLLLDKIADGTAELLVFLGEAHGH